MPKVILTDNDGDKVYEVTLDNGQFMEVPRPTFKKWASWPDSQWSQPAFAAVGPFFRAIRDAKANHSIGNGNGGIFDGPQQVAQAHGALATMLPGGGGSAPSSAIAFTTTFDVVTTGAGEASVDISLDFDAKIVDVEMAEDSVDVKSRLLQVRQNGVDLLAQGSGSGVPAATFVGTSLLRRRFSGRLVNKNNPITVKAKHAAAGKTTLIVHFDRGPGGCN